MNSAKLALVTLAITFLTVACNQPESITTNQPATPGSAGPQATSTPDQFAMARQNFEKYCVACHGEKAQGGRVEIEGRRLKVPSLTKGHAVEHPDERLIKQISEGDDEMPAFKEKLSPEQIDELVRFIRKEFQGR